MELTFCFLLYDQNDVDIQAVTWRCSIRKFSEKFGEIGRKKSASESL